MRRSRQRRYRVGIISILVILMVTSLFAPLASGNTSEGDQETYYVVQDDQTVEVTPIAGDEPVEEFYDYRHPFRDDGDRDHPRWGRSFSSEGTTEYQADDTSILMLYDGPDGLSLVAVHDRFHENDEDGTPGGSVSWELSGLPDDGEWAVIDDDYGWLTDEADKDALHYFDADHTDGAAGNDGEPASGVDAQLSWVWRNSRTDGMAYRLPKNEFSVTIDPAFNGDSYHRYGDDRRSADGPDNPSFGEQYNGTIDDWQVIVPTDDGEDFERVSLESLSEPITVEPAEESNAAEPAAIGVASLSLENDTIEAGETATLTAVLENTAETDGEYEARFRLADSELETKTVDVAGNSEATVEFSQEIGSAGTYRLGVNSEQVELTVTENATAEAETAGSNGEDGGDTTDERLPGFGVSTLLVALLALTAAAGLQRQHG